MEAQVPKSNSDGGSNRWYSKIFLRTQVCSSTCPSILGSGCDRFNRNSASAAILASNRVEVSENASSNCTPADRRSAAKPSRVEVPNEPSERSSPMRDRGAAPPDNSAKPAGAPAAGSMSSLPPGGSAATPNSSSKAASVSALRSSNRRFAKTSSR